MQRCGTCEKKNDENGFKKSFQIHISKINNVNEFFLESFVTRMPIKSFKDETDTKQKTGIAWKVFINLFHGCEHSII